MDINQQEIYKNSADHYLNFATAVNKYLRKQRDAVSYVHVLYMKKFFPHHSNSLDVDELLEEVKGLMKDPEVKNAIDRIFAANDDRYNFTTEIFKYLNQRESDHVKN